MTDGSMIRAALIPGVLALLSLAPACSGDSRNDGGGSVAEDTSTTGQGDGDSADGNSAEGDGDPNTGDGDGDSGDGDPTTGDGDPSTGDGDGDDSGDGDPSTGDGDASTGDGDPGDGDPSTGDGDDSDDGNMACQEFAGDIVPVPPSVMFLLDRSGSMVDTGFDPLHPDKTRWQVLYEAVELVVGDGADAHIAFGAKTFSTQGQGACGVSDAPDVPIALHNADALLAGIPGPLVLVNGGTPTNLALEKTMAIMEFYEAGDSDKFIFLITDGRIGCLDADNPNADDEALADAVALLDYGLTNHGITTYVIGIAPSIWGPIIPQLHEMAIAGGAPKPGSEAFYRADDAQQLADALADVVAESYGKSCLLDLEEAPFFPDYTKVEIGGTVYELVADCDNEDGFVYSKDDYTQIEVCGAACADLGVAQSAEVQYFCTPG
jgi:hypothetical protein